MERRLVLGLIIAKLALPVVVLAAFESNGHGKYSVKGSATGGIPVSGEGKFSAKEDQGNIVFRANVGKDLDMGIRDSHMNKEFGITDGTVLTLTIARSAMKLPGEGAQNAGTVTGKLAFRGVTRDVPVSYKVKRNQAKYVVEAASFSFDYTHFRPDKKDDEKQICKAVICVKPKIDITLEPGSLTFTDR